MNFVVIKAAARTSGRSRLLALWAVHAGLCLVAPAFAQPASAGLVPATVPVLPAAAAPLGQRNTTSQAAAAALQQSDAARRPRATSAAAPPAAAGGFERLATEANFGTPVRRFGVRSGEALEPLPDTPARLPPHYALQVGDEIGVTVWGSVDADWRVRIDRAGRATLPRVGPVALAGATVAELEGLVRVRLERVFRNFEVSVAVTDVSPMRVHITGFVERPGDYVVPGLTTISQALAQAQGPSAGGSWRRIRLVRNERTETVFDLYALLADGNRSDDRLLQPGDVLHIEPVGPQAALLGSVNRVAVFEFLPGETMTDLLRLGGGFATVADRARLTVERLRNRAGVGAVQLELPRDAVQALADGDIVRAVSQVDAELPTQPRNKRVRVEGEVQRPGDYLLPPDATLADALAAAGGATSAGFVYGAELRRESVRVTQELNYERALQELEIEIERAAAARSARDAREDAAAGDGAARQLLQRLRTRRPEGRIVLNITAEAIALPALPLEDRDQLRVPARSQSVGVFGSVFNAGSFVLDGQRRLGDYLQRAGGPTAGADAHAAFVVRANGSVVSARQGGWWSGSSRFENEAALPGDTVFVPEQIDRIGWVQGAKDWTQILYQLGVGLAALRTLR